MTLFAEKYAMIWYVNQKVENTGIYSWISNNWASSKMRGQGVSIKICNGQLTCKSGVSTTSLSFSICSLQPPTSEYVTSGFSST